MRRWIFTAVAAGLFILLPSPRTLAVQQQTGVSVGVQGSIPSAPPQQAPTIATPSNNQTFTNVPVTVAGLCTTDLLVEVFKNGVFAGSISCSNGSYSLQIDLFSGKNDLLARQYDALDQASPDSNVVTVNLNDNLAAGLERPSVTSEFSKRGANPGDTLLWPITISGGKAPFALSVDWGDKSAPDLISLSEAGNLDLKHVYKQSGSFNVTIKLTDSNNVSAFLQVVGIGNGKISQVSNGSQAQVVVKSTTQILPLVVAIAMIPLGFWLGKRHDRQTIKHNLKNGKNIL